MDLERKLQGLQLIAQEKLQAIICSIPGIKDLIIDSSLIKPLENVCSASWLKLKGIQRIHKYDISAPIPRVSDHVQIYMIPSDFTIFQAVLKHIHEIESQTPTVLDIVIKTFHIICVPNSFVYFQNYLEKEGLYGIAQIHRFSWDFLVLDNTLLSLELPQLYGNVFLWDDNSLLTSVAQSLCVLQILCGRPQFVISYGDHAKNVVEIMTRLSGLQNYEAGCSEFSGIVIIDRDKDYASTLLTPAIYAGLLLEVFEQRAGEIDLENCFKTDKQKLEIFKLPSKKKVNMSKCKSTTIKPVCKRQYTLRLNSLCDEIYCENRYKHFAEASSLIRCQAKSISLELQKLNEMKLNEMHEYVARKLPKITELKSKVLRHLNASEKLIEKLAGNYRKVQSLEVDILNNVSRKRLLIEITNELLTTEGQKYNSLRLLCLLHLCCGISVEELQNFIRNYCNYFGAQNLIGFDLLINAGFLPKLYEESTSLNKSANKLLSNISLTKFPQTQFQANANRLKLLVSSDSAKEIVDGKNNTKTACPSNVFNGLYIPLVAKICSVLLRAHSNDELVGKLGVIENICLHKAPTYSPISLKTLSSNTNEGTDGLLLSKPSILVYIVGGVTFAEIGACDIVSKLTNSNIVVASDSIVSGTDLLASAF